MFCGNCFFSEIGEGVAYCPKCGYALEEGNPPNSLPVGSILNGRYLVGRVLGQGGFGITYKALDHVTGDVVAVKEYFPEALCIRGRNGSDVTARHTGDDDFDWGLKGFLREVKTLAQLRDVPGIAHVHEYFEENGTAYFSMDYIEGLDLREWLRRHGGKAPWSELEPILLPVMDALQAVHEQGLVHRDVSPDNVCVTGSGEGVLLDFGAARASLGDRTQTLSVVLKHGYAPKEQYFSRSRQGPWTDVYAMGGTIYRSLTGVEPPDALERLEAVSQGEPDPLLPISHYASVAAGVEDAVFQAMSMEPRGRFQSMRAFRNAMVNSDRVRGGGKPDPGKPNPADEVPVTQAVPHVERPDSPGTTGAYGAYAGAGPSTGGGTATQGQRQEGAGVQAAPTQAPAQGRGSETPWKIIAGAAMVVIAAAVIILAVTVLGPGWGNGNRGGIIPGGGGGSTTENTNTDTNAGTRTLADNDGSVTLSSSGVVTCAEYGYSLTVPTSFTLQGAQDGDANLVNSGLSCTITLTCEDNASGATAGDTLASLSSGTSSSAYTAQGDDWCVVSDESGGSVWYAKAYVESDRIVTMRFDYPSSQKGSCDSVVEAVAPTFVVTGASSASGSTQVSEHTYTLVQQDMTWADAQSYCSSHGGYLATITSEEEYERVLDTMSGTEIAVCWVGGERSGNGWGWVTGETFSFEAWADKEPNNEGGNESCLCLLKNPDDGWGWYDCPNDLGSTYKAYRMGFVMERES